MTELIEIFKNEPRISSLDIANHVDIKYQSVRDMIAKYKTELEMFGKIVIADLKTAISEKTKRNRAKEVAMLNEQQAYFLMTLLKNTPQIVKFKVALVKAFFDMKSTMLLAGTPNIDTKFKEILNSKDALPQLRSFLGDRKFELLIERGMGYKRQYKFIPSGKKKWFSNGAKLYVQRWQDGEIYRWTTGLNDTEENRKYLDENADDVFDKIYQKKQAEGKI